MRYLRFLVPAAALALVFAYVMPSCGVTVATGFSGFLAAGALGAAFAGFYLLSRRVELWLVGRFAKNRLQANHVCQLAVLGTIAATGLLLSGVEWLLPTVLGVTGWSAAVLGGFWLSVIGLALTPTPAITAAFRGGAPTPAPQLPAEPTAPAQPPVVATPDATKAPAAEVPTPDLAKPAVAAEHTAEARQDDAKKS